MVCAFAEEFGTDARVQFSRKNAAFQWEACGSSIPAGEFNVDIITRTYGGGQYKVTVSGPGNKRKALIFTVAAPIASESSQADARPSAASSDVDRRFAQLEALIVRSMPSQAAPQPPQNGGIDLTGMVMKSIEQQGQMVTLLLGKLVEKQTTPQEPMRVSEMKEFMGLLRQFSGGGEREESGGMVDIAKAVLPLLLAQRSPPTAPPTSVRRVVRVGAAKHAGESAARGASAPQSPPSPAPISPPLATRPAEGREGAPDEHAGDNAEGGSALDSIAALLRASPLAASLAVIIGNADDDTPVSSLADVAAGLLGENGEALITGADAGAFTDYFVAAFPALTPKAARVRAVENELREIFAPEPTPAPLPVSSPPEKRAAKDDDVS